MQYIRTSLLFLAMKRFKMNDIIDGGYSMILCKEHEKNSFENTDKILKDMPIKIFGSCTILYWKAWTLKRVACFKLFYQIQIYYFCCIPV